MFTKGVSVCYIFPTVSSLVLVIILAEQINANTAASLAFAIVREREACLFLGLIINVLSSNQLFCFFVCTFSSSQMPFCEPICHVFVFPIGFSTLTSQNKDEIIYLNVMYCNCPSTTPHLPSTPPSHTHTQ